jgi:hypothetical protein
MKYTIDTEFIEEPGYLDLISIGIVCEDEREYYAELQGVDWSRANGWVLENVKPLLTGDTKPKSVIREELLLFIQREPEFWGYFADYDWVAFCWLFGKMVDLPDRFPKFCMDIKQYMIHLGFRKSDIPVTLPTREHNALDDARWNMRVLNWLAARP